MWVLFLLSLVLYIPSGEIQQSSQLVIDIENIRQPKGAIHLALYKDPASFPTDEGIFFGKVIKVNSVEKQQVVIEDLPYGPYALAVYHDTNNNGALDKNWLGVPTEPYAFGKKEPSKWRDPTFDEVAVEVNKQTAKFTVTLAYWKER